MTLLQITLDDASAPSLYRWLAQDDAVRHRVSLSLGDAQPEEMGGALEIVNVVLSNTIAFSSLIVAVASWRATRHPATKVIVVHGTRRVEIEDDSQEAIEYVVKALQEAE